MGLFVINEDSDARSVSKFDDDLYNRISKHDLNTEEGIKGYIQNNMMDIFHVNATINDPSEFDPNKVYLKKKEVNEYGSEVIKYIGKVSSTTFLERLQHRIENFIAKVTARKAFNVIDAKYGEGSIGRRAIAAVKAIKDAILEVLGKILRAIVRALAVAHRFIKDKYNNYKYRKEIQKYDKDSLDTAVKYNKNVRIMKSRNDAF